MEQVTNENRRDTDDYLRVSRETATRGVELETSIGVARNRRRGPVRYRATFDDDLKLSEVVDGPGPVDVEGVIHGDAFVCRRVGMTPLDRTDDGLRVEFHPADPVAEHHDEADPRR